MSKPLSSCRVAVVGLGLMGASLCMDLIQGRLCREVRGVAHRGQTALRAFFEGAVDQATTDLHAGVAGADIVILATPVRTIVDLLAEMGPLLWPGALVMDMGSTKSEICRAMERLPGHVQPIGGHPMTGKEQAGYAAAETGLYRNATWVLSPLSRTSPDTLHLATELVEAVGARPVVLEAQRHDRLVAAISHLPYLVAGALVHAVAETGDDDPTVWDLAAGGFRDTSRVAASDTRMFLDILMTNREAVLAQLDALDAHLHELRALLIAGDEGALREKLD
ncbi:MAG: prephenate dehydrogenase, partial [Caldilineae bacterium]